MATAPDVLGALSAPGLSIFDPEYRRGRRPPNAGMKLAPEPLTSAEVMRLLGACARRGPSGLRNRALIVVLWRGGLRIQEALDLLPKDVDRDGGSITVLSGKGSKRRVVGIDPSALAVVERWIDCRAKLGVPRNRRLFCTIARDELGGPGRPLHSAYCRKLFKQLGQRAGIEKRVHPHGLRHTHAFELAMEGTPVDVIRRQLGHSNLAITARYIDHLAPTEVISAMQAREWDSTAA